MKKLVDYACSFLGQPYRWGGDDPIYGFDCSGLAQEILSSVGLQPSSDLTADGLYRHFLTLGISNYKGAGALAFFGSNARISHVGFMIDNFRMVEAGGGGSKTQTRADAAKQNAYIRIRSIYRRRDLINTILPKYNDVGLSW